MGQAALKIEWKVETVNQGAQEPQGKAMETCPKHGQNAVGPLVGAVCLRCQPFMAQPCRICWTPRYKCCC